MGEHEGYTMIPNDILEAMAKAKLNGSQYALVMAICRYTLGFNRCEWKLSQSYLAEATGMNERQVRRELKELLQRNIVTAIKKEGITSTLKINKEVDTWIPLEPRTKKTGGSNQTPDKLDLSPRTNQTGDPGLNRPPRNKELKKTIKENIFSVESDEIQLSILLYQKTLEHYPSFQEPDYQKWAKHIDLLKRINNKSPTEIRAVILWAKKDTFWQPNIMSTKKLRDKYDTLNARRLAEKPKGGENLDYYTGE
jgi:phage replication O-like protein O